VSLVPFTNPELSYSIVERQSFDAYCRPHTDVRKCHTLYLAGQFSFQDLLMETLLFDGNPSSKFGLSSMSVMEALKKLASPQGELTPYELHSVGFKLDAGSLKSVGLGLMTWDSPDNCHGLPYSKLRIRPSLLQLCQTDHCWSTRNIQGVLGSLHALLQHRSNLLAFDKHGYTTSVSAGMSRRPRLGWTWVASPSHRHPNSLGPGDLRHVPPFAQGFQWQSAGKHGRRLFEGQCCWFDWRPGGTSDTAMAIWPDDGHLVLLPNVLIFCLEWLERENRFDELTSDEKLNMRAVIGHQLHEVGVFIPAKEVI